MSTISRHLRIMGRVQGVSYRAWAQAEARALGLTGFVRNETDGSVTAVISGPRDKVEEMITACHAGPGAADVRDVRVEETPDPGLPGFEVQRTN